ncbi:MAG TPA: hypothetical protein ENI57_06555 [Ignavibacteria bacterium]|nr:hypothetical protein [Ignavibacteria bacterium]
MQYNQHLVLRKIHRYFGLFIGIQFLFWTISGLYFSWSDIDKIHGDQFRTKDLKKSFISPKLFSNLQDSTLKIQYLELKFVNQTPYLWINKEKLIDPFTGKIKESISKNEALAVANQHILPEYRMKKIEYLTEVGPDHEYRKLPLPAWVIYYEGNQNLRAYVSARDGSFQRIRYDSWRIFDFLWMTHTMDYQGRDNINNWLLRTFSVLGLLTVLSGFLLYFYSLGKYRKLKKDKL